MKNKTPGGSRAALRGRPALPRSRGRAEQRSARGERRALARLKPRGGGAAPGGAGRGGTRCGPGASRPLFLPRDCWRPEPAARRPGPGPGPRARGGQRRCIGGEQALASLPAPRPGRSPRAATLARGLAGAAGPLSWGLEGGRGVQLGPLGRRNRPSRLFNAVGLRGDAARPPCERPSPLTRAPRGPGARCGTGCRRPKRDCNSTELPSPQLRSQPPPTCMRQLLLPSCPGVLPLCPPRCAFGRWKRWI